MLNQAEVEKRLENTSYTLVGKWKGTTVYHKFKSKDCGHTFEMLWKNLWRKINSGETKCKKCSIKDVRKRLTPEEIKEFVSSATQKEYKVVSLDGYSNNKDKIKILHKSCGNVFETSFSNFNFGRRCSFCSRKTQESKAAQLLKRVLEHLGEEFEEEKVFDICKNPFTNQCLRFDLYLKKYDLLIEIDGEQHFIPISRFGGKKGLDDTQYRDYLKNRFCFEEKKKLLRFSLYDVGACKKKSYEEIKLEIFHFLNKIKG